MPFDLEEDFVEPLARALENPRPSRRKGGPSPRFLALQTECQALRQENATLRRWLDRAREEIESWEMSEGVGVGSFAQEISDFLEELEG